MGDKQLPRHGCVNPTTEDMVPFGSRRRQRHIDEISYSRTIAHYSTEIPLYEENLRNPEVHPGGHAHLMYLRTLDMWSSLQLRYTGGETIENLRIYLGEVVAITALPNGLWIELGTEPSLYPVKDGCPPLPALLNNTVRAIRNDNMDLVGFPQWDDDPNERFSREDSVRWLWRFDEDSDWPTAELRRSHQMPPANAQSSVRNSELRVKAGQPCPQSGRWQKIDSSEEVRYYQLGEALIDRDSVYGITVWRYIGP